MQDRKLQDVKMQDMKLQDTYSFVRSVSTEDTYNFNSAWFQ